MSRRNYCEELAWRIERYMLSVDRWMEADSPHYPWMIQHVGRYWRARRQSAKILVGTCKAVLMSLPVTHRGWVLPTCVEIDRIVGNIETQAGSKEVYRPTETSGMAIGKAMDRFWDLPQDVRVIGAAMADLPQDYSAAKLRRLRRGIADTSSPVKVPAPKTPPETVERLLGEMRISRGTWRPSNWFGSYGIEQGFLRKQVMGRVLSGEKRPQSSDGTGRDTWWFKVEDVAGLPTCEMRIERAIRWNRQSRPAEPPMRSSTQKTQETR